MSRRWGSVPALAVWTAAFMAAVLGLSAVTVWRLLTDRGPSPDPGFVLGVLICLGAAVVLAVAALVLYCGTDAGRPSASMTKSELSDCRVLQAELHRQAFGDSLTGLPNRAWGLKVLERGVRPDGRLSGGVAVLELDIDGFKGVNDAFGHDVGDAVLRVVARRLRSTLRPDDTLARLGPDEFLVVMAAPAPERAAQELACRLGAVLNQTLRLGRYDHRIRVSTGVAVAGGGTPEELLRNAELAMYQAKFLGGGRTVTFEQRMHDDARRRVQLEMDLDWAVDREEMIVHFQPIVDLEEAVVRGAEALVRWQHPNHGLIGPAEFIPLAERGGQIAGIGRFVLTEACRRAVAWGWNRDHGRGAWISVNVSGRQLMDPGSVDVVAAVLADSGLDPATLVLEITETVLMEDNLPVLGRIQELKRLGVRIALDDYGTGYSSMARLAFFPVDVLKIDRCFVASAARGDQTALTLVKSMVALCEDLGIEAVAEGIESAEEAALMAACGFRLGQGYLTGRPMAADRFEALLGSVASRRQSRRALARTFAALPAAARSSV